MRYRWCWLLILLSMGVACGGRSLSGIADASLPATDQAQAPTVDSSPPTEGLPAGQCNTNDDCAGTQYCRWPIGLCLEQPSSPLAGECRPRPDGCLAVYLPVCGCDGVTYGNACQAEVAGISLAHDGACDPACEGVSCQLINDCCNCVPRFPPNPGAPCSDACEQPLCDAVGFQDPLAYCLAGQCLIANTLEACTQDTDCVRVEDCCDLCAALPKSVPYAQCKKGCATGHCTAIGLGAAKPRCVLGSCRLTLSP